MFNDDLLNASCTSNDQDVDDAIQTIIFYEWQRDDGKVKKVMVKRKLTDVLNLLESAIRTLKEHMYTKRVQYCHYNEIKSNLKRNQLLLHVGYSESYENKQQGEIQSAYFGHAFFSILLPTAIFVG